MIEFPPIGAPPAAFFPLALRPTDLTIQNIAAAMSAAQAATLITSGGGVLTAQRILSAAEFNALNVTPVEIVPGVPGKLILPVFWTMDKDTTVTGTTAAIDLRWTGTANVAVTAMSVGCNSMGRLTSQARGADTAQSAGAVNPTGLGLSVKAAGALTGTTAIVIGVAFYIITAIANHA